MISNERPSPFHRLPTRQPYHQPYAPQSPRPFVQEDTLKSEQIQIERKSFVLTLKENPRGRFVRIVEQNGNRPPTSIIVPSTGLREFHKLVCEMMDADRDIPEKGNAA